MRAILPQQLEDAAARRIEGAARALAAMSPHVVKSISIMQIIDPGQESALYALVARLERRYGQRASIEGRGSVTVRFQRGHE